MTVRWTVRADDDRARSSRENSNPSACAKEPADRRVLLFFILYADERKRKMALFPCPECLRLVSTEAMICPFCDSALKAIDESEYDVRCEQVFCTGMGSWNAVMEPLSDVIDDGWEIVSVVPNPFHSTMMKTAFDVLLKRPKDYTPQDISTADASDEDTPIEAKAYDDIADFYAEINATPTADLKLIVSDQADLYTSEEMAFIRAVLTRRGEL